MKAKLSYTVDFDAIPWEVNKLLRPELGKLEDTIKDLDLNVTKNNVDLTLLRIDNLRRMLVDVDTRLSECYSILQGFKEVTVPSPLPKTESTNDEPQSG